MQRLERNYSPYVMDQSCEPSSSVGTTLISRSRKRPIEVIDISDWDLDSNSLPTRNLISARTPVQVPVSDSVTPLVPVPVTNLVRSPVANQVQEVITIDDSDDDDVVFYEPEKEEIIINDTEEEEKERRFFEQKDSLSKAQKMHTNSKFVKYDEWPSMKNALKKINEKLSENPILKDNLNFDDVDPEDVPLRNIQMRAIRLHQQFHDDLTKASDEIVTKCAKQTRTETTKETLRSAFFELLEHSRYQPPIRRLQIMKNLTLDVKTSLPVYCDRTTDDSQIYDIPETLIFDYIKHNVIGNEVKSKLQKLVDLSEENIISCNCCEDGGKMVKCYENPDCLCYKMNEGLSKLQTINTYRKTATTFKTFEKIKMRDVDHYFDTLAFSCSSSCKCKGCCDNNVMYTIENDLNRFEVFRYDDKGFCIRPLNYIPYGSPVFEFTGEVVDNKTVVLRDSEDYSFTITNKASASVEFIEFIDKSNCLTEELKEELKKTYKRTWNIDPKKRGNEGRFVAHGCHPNLSVCRVFQRGLGPHQTKLIMVSLEDIFPGTTLSFDYGDEYIKKQLSDKCLCHTAGCKTLTNVVSKAAFVDMFKFLEERYIFLSADYLSCVTEKISVVEAQIIKEQHCNYFMTELEKRQKGKKDDDDEHRIDDDFEYEERNSYSNENRYDYANRIEDELEYERSNLYSNESRYDVENKVDDNVEEDSGNNYSNDSGNSGEYNSGNWYSNESSYSFGRESGENERNYGNGYERNDRVAYETYNGDVCEISNDVRHEHSSGLAYDINVGAEGYAGNEYHSEPIVNNDHRHNFNNFY